MYIACFVAMHFFKPRLQKFVWKGLERRLMGHGSILQAPFSGPSGSPLGGRKAVEVESWVWAEVSVGGLGPPTGWGGDWDWDFGGM